ncbi:hypothetical protein [Chachezhania sediminis]|uniref:hypothetical protein n=1 Tax=Chachezhania sediminis TaxID=2599291 RepID=UPI00131AFB06|nr:hypothetical protein [Chachezhania sediminis]
MELTRGIDPVLLTAISNPAGFYPAVLISSVWPDGTAWVHSGDGDLPWNGEIWSGIAPIAEAAVPGERSGLVPGEGTLTVRGTFEAVLSYADPAARNGLVQMYVAATTEPGGTVLIGTPHLAFTGYLDANSAVLDAATGDASLTVTAGTGPAAREHAALYHSPEDQKARHPGDTLLERAAVATQWRSTRIQFPNPG